MDRIIRRTRKDGYPGRAFAGCRSHVLVPESLDLITLYQKRTIYLRFTVYLLFFSLRAAHVAQDRGKRRAFTLLALQLRSRSRQG